MNLISRVITASLLSELGDRAGFDGWWGDIDDDIRQEIVCTLEEIVDGRVGPLVESTTLARNTFEGYAALHREKGTEEGDAKAALNQELAMRMNMGLEGLTLLEDED